MIGTFHSLSARLLRREAPLLGFGPNFTIYDSDDSEALVKRLLRGTAAFHQGLSAADHSRPHLERQEPHAVA